MGADEAWPVTGAVDRPLAATFDDFFADEYAGLVALLTATTGARAVAEELAQEAMLRAHQRWPRISGYDQPGAWVRRVGLNLASNSWARRRTERRTVERLAGEPVRPATTAQDGLDGIDFWALVRRLPPRQAAAVTLYYLEDRPVAEVAAILGCAEGTAKAHLHKGRAGLALLLDEPEADHGP
jgi:RNA polymerase sigma-70 factor (ECF subfamily)